MDLTPARTAGPSIDRPETGPLEATWLGRRAYREIWALQKDLAGARATGTIGDRLLLVEHDRVLTLGRHADEGHVRATAAELARRGIELIRVERGGEVTYHGPGQLVVYPIIALSRRGLLVRPLVRALEAAMVSTCAAFGVAAARRDGHPGSWIDPDGPEPRKVGALGIRVERGVSYHGIALNVDPDLTDFELIDACGLPDTVSTSIGREAAWPTRAPSTATAPAMAEWTATAERTAMVERAAAILAGAFARAIDVRLEGFGSGPDVPPAAAPAPGPARALAAAR